MIKLLLITHYSCTHQSFSVNYCWGNYQMNVIKFAIVAQTAHLTCKLPATAMIGTSSVKTVHFHYKTLR